MEEKKKKKQEEKKKKESAPKKAPEQTTKVPDSAKPGPTPRPPPLNSSATPSVPPSTGSNGKRAPSSAQQSQPSPAQPRYSPREVPPRFRQQEPKQLLKRGQPLPPGTLAPLSGRPQPDPSQNVSGVAHAELPPHTGPGAQYENPRWGQQPANQSSTSASASTNHSGWDPVIIDDSDTEAWPSISRSSQGPAGGCPSDTDPGGPASSSSISMSMATGANGQTGHFPANHPSSKEASSGPGGPANHHVGIASGPGASNRGWGSGPGSSPHVPAQSSSIGGGEGKGDGTMGGGGGGRGWGSTSSTTSNFNLNLNPNANPSAWPVLGHDGDGGSLGGVNPNQTPSQPPSNLCKPINTPPAQGNGNGGGTMGGCTNGNLPVGCVNAWGDSPEQHPSLSTNVSFSSEPLNLNTDGPNQTSKQHETPSPICSLPSWGGPSGGIGSLGQPPAASPQQVNGEDDSSIWGNNGESKSVTTSKEPSSWDSGASGWGSHGNSGGGTSGGWGAKSSGDSWGKQHSGEGQGGWDSPSSPPQPDQQASSWSTRPPSTAAASEGSSEGMEGAGHSRRRDRSSRDESVPLLPAPDLDPRVLCNTGWGQTPVRQHTSWDMEEAARAQRKADAAGTDSWGGSGPNTPTEPPQGPSNHGPTHRGGLQAAPDWGGSMPPTTQPGSGWGEPPSNKKPPTAPGVWLNPPQGGSRPGPNMPKGGNQSWGAPEEKSPSWDDPHSKTPKTQGWREGPKPSQGSWSNSGGGSGGDWGEPGEGKKHGTTTNPPWEGEGGWKESNRGWGKPGLGGNGGGNGGGGGGWGEPAMAPQRPSGPTQGWGGKPQESSSSSSVVGGGSIGSWGGPGPVKPSGSGWGGNGGGGGGKQDPSGGEPTGWEEPSPPSIRRKMEIDDGTSAWGDPGAYNKTVNLWDKNNPGGVPQARPPGNPPGNSSSGSSGNNNIHHAHPSHHLSHHPHTYHGPPPPLQSHGGHNPQGPGLNSVPMDPAVPHQTGHPPHSRPPLMGPGWGELPSGHPKPEPSWGEPAPPPVSVDNGTSAWGQPTGNHGGWGGGDNGPEPYGRGNPTMGSAPCKQAPKSMQGGGEDLGLSGGQWDPDDGDMWNSQASQESNSWGNGPKKGPPKGKIPGKQEEAWVMSRLVKQLTDMGFPRDPAAEALKSNNMNLDQAMSALLEKKTELDKRVLGMSDYNNSLINKSCRPPLHSKESSSDRSPFLDKDGGSGLVEDVHTSPFMPSPGSLGLKLSSLPSTALPLPGQGLGGPQGLAMQNLNNRQVQSGMFGSGGAAQARAMQMQQPPPPQPSVPPLSSSQPSLRAQVPQFLSPQVQAQLLQFAAKNIGLNPALLSSPINPQHMTLLNQLYQLQLAYQRLQIQQQMLQAQRNVSGPIRQQEQQVARTINNMQQQIQQHQRQLTQALLMKQQPPGSLSSGVHHGKTTMDSFPSHPQAPGLSDLQTKELQASLNSYGPYPLCGLTPNMNVNLMDVGGLSMKEPAQPQSRLSQWTHPNPMERLSGGSSPLEPNLGKHGANLGPPGKPPQIDDGYSPFSMMPGSESPTSSLVPPPDSWGQGKSANDKMVNGSNITWPPEFCPGVPWKGLQNIDPENDPNMTPGSVPSGPTINTNIQDVNRYLQRDRSGGSSPTSSQNEALPPSTDWPVSVSSQNEALPPSNDWPVSAYPSSFSLSSPETDDPGKLSDMKSTWSPGPISHPSHASLSHELWKVPQGPRSTTAAPTRPPPGLTNPTKSSSTWGGNSLGLAQGWSSSYSSGTTWSTDSSNRTSSWLVLRNLTPQIDGSTLRTLCMQHGPLITFHLNLTQGNALVRYSSKEEAAKAQKSLHMCVLGNTTILAEFAGEEEVQRFFAQGQQLASNTSWQAEPGINQTRMGGSGPRSSHPIGHPHWNSGGSGGSGGMGGGGAKTGGDLLWGGVPKYSGLWGPPSREEGRVMGSPTPINTLLPGDLLSGESM
ncbi:trinucleotide repeat-containing gene 6C protein isoform X1 [Esox lucius]|uniref:Trinucleotide repeat-containing gene 6C protein n=1 Tax=Esox lucius TaxID=8010 RepID=A0A3P8XVI6_ESOLU|nr:trinucleotide repeat-containing gene 6C protein isoform X1 [Esox lucius]XP_028978957.2 trinucleotide repeat-containing gene 6C protein isoform X1 [Esox lucius]XP_028978958.2 trinucleotide repeat-containing gene 6C protein isoform X1 [Esox lucius]